MPSSVQVKQAVNDWYSVLIDFGLPAELLTKKGSSCPICHDGEDRFVYDNKYGNGDAHCRVCGAMDGIGMIVAFTGWSFSQTMRELGIYLGLKDEKLSDHKMHEIRMKKLKREYISAMIIVTLAHEADLNETDRSTFDRSLAVINKFNSEHSNLRVQIHEDKIKFLLIAGVIAGRLKRFDKPDRRQQYQEMTKIFQLEEPKFEDCVKYFMKNT